MPLSNGGDSVRAKPRVGDRVLICEVGSCFYKYEGTITAIKNSSTTYMVQFSRFGMSWPFQETELHILLRNAA